MPSLDCQDVDSALSSLGGLLSMKPAALRAALMDFPPNEFEDFVVRGAWQGRPCEAIWDYIAGPGSSPPIPDLIYWFHATRVPPETDFAEGILCLGDRVPAIEALLREIADRCAVPLAPPDRPRGSFQYGLKVPNPSHWGPFAFLVRDAIVRRHSGTHDYLASPEIVEDLAESITADPPSERLLLEAFRRATRPCIVKFHSAAPRDDVVVVALLYAYWTLCGEAQDRYMNTCFDRGGRSIPAADIVQVEWDPIV